MPERPPNLDYAVADRPPPLQVALLGLQFAAIISVYLVLVVIVVRAAGAAPAVATSAVSLGMIAIAIATVLQALPRGPIGSGYMAPPVYSAIYLGPSLLAAHAGGLPAVFAMTVFAGLVEIVASRFLERLRIIIQPTISGLIITVIGLELGIVGMQQALDVSQAGSPELPAHVLTALVTLSIAIGLSVWARGVWRLIASLTGMLAGMAAAVLAGIYAPDAAARLAGADWLALPGLGHIAFAFEPALIPAFLAAGLAATLRTVGVVTTCQRINDAGWREPDYANIRKGVLADGIGCAAGGLLGAPGMNIAPSLVGVSVAAGVTSRVVAYAAAAVLVVLAFTPKVATVFLVMPMPVAGAILVFTASLMLAAGLQLLTSKPLDTRAMLMIGVAVLIGITRLVNPDFFERLPQWLHLVSGNTLSLSLAVGIGLTLLFRLGRREEESLAWTGSDKAVDALKADLEARAAEWEIAEKDIERAVETVRKVLGLLKEGGLIAKPLAFGIAHRRGELEVELRYQGLPLHLPDPQAQGATAHEEAPMASGLHRVALAAHPDAARTTTAGDRVKLRLTFRS